jgi:hypothetical protein
MEAQNMEPWRLCRPVVADLHHIDEEYHPHLSEKLHPDPHYNDANPKSCLKLSF